MHLQPGMTAPAFEAENAWGNPIRLDHDSRRPVLLSFFRNAACALCNLRVHQLITRFPDYHRAGMDILAVFESPAAAMRAHVGQQDAPFPLIADPSARLYDLYGVETSAEKVAATIARPETAGAIAAAAELGFALRHEEGSNFDRIPADFLIDPDLVIARAHYAEVVTDHLPLAEIDAFAGLVLAAV